jgi:DNA-binding transcriptional LysR family regulator
MADWDDVRFVLALSRNGSIRKAAKALGVNHTTVARRISAFEKRLSARLVEKTPSAYVLTASGRIICSAAEEMESILTGAQRRVEGADTELSGDVHIHIPDIFDEWISEKLAAFSKQHPKLNLLITNTISRANLAQRETDIALRFSQSPPEDMVGRKVCSLPVALYTAIDFEIDPLIELASYPWVRWDKPYINTPPEQVAEKMSSLSSTTLHVTTYHSMTNLIRHGAGIGILSPWFADEDSRLKRISPNIDDGEMDVWMLIHPDLRGVKRIKAITDMLLDLFERKIPK